MVEAVLHAFLLTGCSCKQSSSLAFFTARFVSSSLFELMFLHGQTEQRNKLDRSSTGKKERDMLLFRSVPQSHMFVPEEERRLSADEKVGRGCFYLSNSSELSCYSTICAVVCDLRGAKTLRDHLVHLKA